MIDSLQLERCSQNRMDLSYEAFCKCVFQEMDRNVKFIDASKKMRKKYKHSKPYWNDNLTMKWKAMNESERKFLKCKESRRRKSQFYLEFKKAQKDFDKSLTKASREFRRQSVLKIEELNTGNHKSFWKHIKSLGPHKTKNVPLQVKRDDCLISDKSYVLNKWETDFSSLYNKPSSLDSQFDQEFVKEMLETKTLLESCMSQSCAFNDSLNSRFSIEELKHVTNRIQFRKAVGIDKIPNEVLKSDSVSRYLLQLFNVCFVTGKVPSSWSKAVIKPITKGR